MKSRDDLLRFGEFTLDPVNRRLSRGTEPVQLGGRYLDTLVMLARAPGELVSKNRLHEEVWRGVPVTDEALSQAIMALRKALGDDAARPRYIETVPRHGYRFVAALDAAGQAPLSGEPDRGSRLQTMTGGILGALAAGIVVGLAYGTLASTSAPGNAFSLVMVLLGVSILSAIVSGTGVVGGIVIAKGIGGTSWWRPFAGGALGGCVVGWFARLLGLDTLRLLMGRAPQYIAGATEGVVMGGVVGAGCVLLIALPPRRAFALIALLGAMAGGAIVLGGGTLMAGSLAALMTNFPGASLSMAWVSNPATAAISGAFEGSAFATLVCAGIWRGGRS